MKGDDSKSLNWITKPIDVSNALNTQGNNPLNAGMAINANGLARGEVLAVEEDTSWIKDFYKM